MDERKKSNMEKDKEDKVKNWAADAKKKSPGTEVNNRMDERKKSNMEKEKKDEVKNWAADAKKNPLVLKWIIGSTKEKVQYWKRKRRRSEELSGGRKKKSSMEKEKDNPEVKKRIWGGKKNPMKRSE